MTNNSTDQFEPSKKKGQRLFSSALFFSLFVRAKFLGLLASIGLIIFFFAFSFWIDQRSNAGITPQKVTRIEHRLHKLQQEVFEIVEQAFLQFDKDSNIYDFDEFWPSSMVQDQVSLFVLKEKELLFWSDNLPATLSQLTAISTNAQYINLGNGWYVAQSFRHNGYTAIALQLVQTDFPFQNEFMKNRLNGFFQFPLNTIVSPLGTDMGLAVHSREGTPLFIVSTDVSLGKVANLSMIARWLGIAALLVLVLLIFHNPLLYRKSPFFLLLALLVLIAIRVHIFINTSYFTQNLSLFSPAIYADSGILPSLGDLGLHVLFLFLYLLILYSAKDTLAAVINARPNVARVGFLTSSIVIGLFAHYVQYIITSLTTNSNISFAMYRMADVSWNTLLAFFLMGTLLAELFMMIWLQVHVFKKTNALKRYGLSFLLFLLLYAALTNHWDPDRIGYPVLYALFLLLCSWKNKNNRLPLGSFILFVLLSASYLSASLLYNGEQREREKRQLLAQNLSTERDPVAEMLLFGIEQKLNNDPYLKEALATRTHLGTEFLNRLTDQYLRGYFQRYDIYYHICQPTDPLFIHYDTEEVNCVSFFHEEKELYGKALPKCSHFWFMNNYSGRICYLGQFSFPINTNKQTRKASASDSVTLFINLYSKLDIEAIGYPELLLDTKSDTEKEMGRYSYAKYSNKKLVSHYGDFDYSFELQPWLQLMNNHFFSFKRYDHYIYWADEHTSIVISKEELWLMDIASMFSYTLVILCFLQLFLCLCAIKFDFDIQRLSYRWRISIVLLVSITFALTTLAIAILVYTVRQTEKRNIESIEDKMQSITMQLDQNQFGQSTLTPEMRGELNTLLIKLSNAFYTDLNLYDLSGDLIASSRNEIFEKKLLGTKMNWQVYRNFTQSTSSKYIHKERIGSMEFYSAYTTYYNRYGEPIAFVNLPYFFEQSKFRNELLSLVGTIVSIYIFLIIGIISISILVSNQLTRPLNEVRQKMGRLDLLKQPEPIDYRGNNELGDLVREYNRMILELAESAHKLAESEREMAWREMAQQIAHEIKNPLTPMKLGLQHALRMKQENRDGWQAKMEQVALSVLEQIEVLAITASEFSNFSLISKSELSSVDLSEVVASSVKLFRAHSEVKIYLEEDKYLPKLVHANKEQLQRVFTNLIKNAIQAMEEVKRAKVHISLRKADGMFVIQIKDNGSGISEELRQNLFQPKFTTKSGGTGLGLAISRSIIESFGGTIVFVEQEVGACFEIQLPEQQQ